MYLVLGIPLRERHKQGSIMSVGASEKTDIMDVLKPVVDDLRNCERYNYTPVFIRDVLWYGDIRLSIGLCVVPCLRPPVFRIFLLHALTYSAEILHMTLF